jgi:glycosyltransferase involved in cell wall biosynthesis
MRPLYFNGKFYAGGMNGVHRVADRLIREVDALLAAEGRRATLLLPRQRQRTPELRAIDLEEQANGHSQRWEHLTLPRRTADGVLVNLCNLAPLRHSRQVLLIHDAQFLFRDNGYPARQRIGYRLLTPRMARASAAVLTVSEYSRSILDLTGVSRRERTDVLHNGADHILEVAADPGILSRTGLEPGRFVLIFGSPKAYKNVEVVFAALRQPTWPAGVRLAVVGPDRSRLEAAGLAVPDEAVFVGGIDDQGLRGLYENALAMAFPSRTEGFGLPPIEGMLCGCPAIVSPAGAIPEVCTDAALYAAVDAPAEWADRVARLAGDVALRERQVAAGRERARHFTWAASGAALHARLSDLVRS